MTKIISVSGFCPTLNCDYTIDVEYQSYGTAGRYLQTGACCDYASMEDCPIMLACPLRASAPKDTTL